MKITGRTSILLVTSMSMMAQKKDCDLPALLSKNKLTIINRKVSSVNDPQHKGIHLDEADGNGIVWLQDVTFSSGTIVIDLQGRDLLQRSCIGVAFHVVNDSTYDAVYFRPFNFHSTDPVRKIHAVQYIFE